MADISKIKLNGITYDIKDTIARSNSSGITETVGNTKYLRLDGTNKPTAKIDFNQQNLTGVNTLDVSTTSSTRIYLPCGADYLGTDTYNIFQDSPSVVDLSLYTRDNDGNFSSKDADDQAVNYDYGIYGGACASNAEGTNITSLGEGFFLNENIFNAMQRPLLMDGHTIGYTTGLWVGAPDHFSKMQCFISVGGEKSIQLNVLNDDVVAEYETPENLDKIINSDSNCFTTDQVRLMNVATPLDNTDAVNKQYADSVVSEIKSSYLPLSGGTLSGVLSAGGNKIISVATPTGNADAANKSYVDSQIPTALKNPNSISFTGASVATYDGSSAVIVNIPVIPTSLKNPNKLSFTGAVNTTYDGSAAVSVAITQVKLKSWTAEDFT